VSEKLDRFVTAALLTAAIYMTVLNLHARAEPGAPREDAFASELKTLEDHPGVSRAYALWLEVGCLAAAGVCFHLAWKRRRGQKIADSFAEPPPWGVGDFTVVFVGSMLLQSLAFAALPRTSVIVGGKPRDLAKPVALEGAKIERREGELHLLAPVSSESRISLNEKPLEAADTVLATGDTFRVGASLGHVEGPTQIQTVVAWGVGSLFAPLLVLVGVRLRGAPLRELGLQGFTPAEALRGVVGYVAMVPGVVALTTASAWLCKSLDVPVTVHPLLHSMRDRDPRVLILIFIVAAVIAPISEEILFRGYFLRALRRPFPGRAAAVLAASFFFGAFHPGLALLLPITWVGAVFSILFLTSERRSLLSAMVCHSCFNGVEIALSYVLLGR